MRIDREWKAMAGVSMWRKVNRQVRWKQFDQARRTLWNKLRSCTPGGGWTQEAKIGNITVDYFHADSGVVVELYGGYHNRMSYLTTSDRTHKVIVVPAQPDVDRNREVRLIERGIQTLVIHDYQTTQPQVLARLVDQIRDIVLWRLGRAPAPPSRPGEYIAEAVFISSLPHPGDIDR